MTTELQPTPTIDYYAAPGVSKTALWTFRNRRRLYEAEYVTHTAPPRKAMKEQDVGLTTELWSHLYAVCPTELLSKDGKATTAASKR